MRNISLGLAGSLLFLAGLGQGVADPCAPTRQGGLHLYAERRQRSEQFDPWATKSEPGKPASASRPLYAGHRLPSHQAPDRLVPEGLYAPGFDDICFFT